MSDPETSLIEVRTGKLIVVRSYTPEFKREAMRLVQTSGKPIAQIARELGISDSSIYQWHKKLAEHGAEAFPGSGHQTAFGGGESPSQAGTGANTAGTRHSKKNVGLLAHDQR